jgi:hypothetical protein
MASINAAALPPTVARPCQVHSIGQGFKPLPATIEHHP